MSQHGMTYAEQAAIAKAMTIAGRFLERQMEETNHVKPPPCDLCREPATFVAMAFGGGELEHYCSNVCAVTAKRR